MAPKSETTEARKCACGCGQTPKGKKTKFAQGHDATLRHKAIVAFQNSESLTINGKTQSPASVLAEHNWAEPKPKSARKATTKKASSKKSTKKSTRAKAKSKAA